jgi:hypothetical protein
MDIAFRSSRAALLNASTGIEACARAKHDASFAGTMRSNLCSMLDEIGLPTALGISRSIELFGAHCSLLHSTSAIRYPVFVTGQNYTGHNPPLLKHPLLRQFVENVLGPELRSVPDALLVPLGTAVEEALAFLASIGVVRLERCLLGFPHPSGAYAGRIGRFREIRDSLQRSVRRWGRV